MDDKTKELVAHLRKAEGIGRWTKAMHAAAEAIERLNSENADLEEKLEQANLADAAVCKKLAEVSAELHAANSTIRSCDELIKLGRTERDKLRDELAALKSASAEPVAWMTKQGGWVRITDDPKNPDGYDIPLYTAPAAVPEDAKDAARYRWLRKQHGEQMPVASVVWKKGSVPSSALWCNLINASDLDKHIDAAMESNHAKP